LDSRKNAVVGGKLDWWESKKQFRGKGNLLWGEIVFVPFRMSEAGKEKEGPRGEKKKRGTSSLKTANYYAPWAPCWEGTSTERGNIDLVDNHNPEMKSTKKGGFEKEKHKLSSGNYARGSWSNRVKKKGAASAFSREGKKT